MLEPAHALAELVKPALRYDPKFPRSTWKNLVRDYPVAGNTVKRLPDGGWELRFDGNRIDVLAAHGGGSDRGTAQVLIDGKKPSAFPGAYHITRPSKTPVMWWPAVMRVSHDKPLLVEKWTLRVLQSDPAGRKFSFNVIGSRTGPDGQGTSDQRFVSNSGRVILEPRDWLIAPTLRMKKATMPKDFTVTWQVEPMFVDTYKPPLAPDASREYPTTLAQGIPNGPHTLRLLPTGDGPVAIQGFRVYRPPLK